MKGSQGIVGTEGAENGLPRNSSMGGNAYGCIPLCLVGTESLELASAFIF